MVDTAFVLQHIEFHGQDACWPWMGNHHAKNGRPLYAGTTAARVVWSVFNGQEFPANREAHHTCYNGLCVNPWHLTPMTRPGHRQHHGRLITHCAQGHEYNPENTYVRPNGTRDCRACNRERQRRRSVRQRQTSDTRS